jgi:hypothetical protein
VLSVTLWYHFGFLVIATGLLGFGAAGSALSAWSWLRDRADLDGAAGLLAAAYGAATVLAHLALQRVPFAPFSLLEDPLQALWTPLYLGLVACPFGLAGLVVALLLTRAGGRLHRVYAWDLAGAGAGCGAALLLLPALGGSGAVIASGAAGALSGAPLAGRARPAVVAASLALGLGLLAAALSADAWAPLRLTANKTSRAVPATWTRWDAFSRVDLLERPGRRVFRIDGGSAFTGTVDPRPWLEGHTESATVGPTLRELGVPFAVAPAPRVLVIGSGAGAEVLEALRLGAQRVTALEVNPIIVETVRRDPFWGDLFHRADVELHATEARSFIRRTEASYDLIVSVHTISNAAMAAGALALAESHILTLEAFADYLERLGPRGLLYITRPEAQLPRLVATARSALEGAGVLEPERSVFAWRARPPRPGARSFSAGLVIRRAPFTPEERAAMAGALDPARFERLYPRASPEGGLRLARHTDVDIYRALLETPELGPVLASSRTRLDPATDDRPFFHHRTRWSQLGLDTLRAVLSQRQRARMALEDQPLAEVTLVLLLVEAGALGAVFIFLPLLRLRKEGLRTPRVARWLAFFGLVGVGFIVVEIVLMQRLTLYLGKPALTYSTVVGGLLVSSGAGAALSRRLASTWGRSLFFVPALLVAATAAAIPALADSSLALPLASRISLALLAIAPLGLALGLPFPAGLARVAATAPGFVPWAWGVNAFFTVIGTVLATMLGMSAGFGAALVLGGLAYVGAGLAAPR